MAIARKCDRCGNLYAYYPTGNKSQYNAIRKIQTNIVGETINGAHGLVIDFCPECMDEFEKFMAVKFQEEKK